MAIATPTNIQLHQKSRILEIEFDDGQKFELSCEYLRTHSPSAEVQGHGPGQEKLQIGKEDVNITAIEPVGNYAVVLVFDDNHSSGIFSWDHLHNLGTNKEANWTRYLERLKEAGHEREPKDG
ncbi:MAG: DUF971 domain-containing protein [Gammaproteobacteria bacterium]|nr:MAG: DUF971 domain-containing protein [Gammaproteobacteria bacterium]